MARSGKGKGHLETDDGSLRLRGGKGDDLFEVRADGVTIHEARNGGLDSVIADVSYALDDWIENLWLDGVLDINATGNELDNQIGGNTGDNELVGGLGDDTMSGGAGDDTMSGGEGDDVAQFLGSIDEYVFAWEGDVLTVSRLLADGSREVDDLVGFETLSFDDADLNVADIAQAPQESQPPAEEPIDPTPPPDDSADEPDAVPYYISALIHGEGVRWNLDEGAETTTITYAFLTEVPDYYAPDAPERNEFEPFNELQEAAAREALALIESYTNIVFEEVPQDQAMMTLGSADLNSGSAWAYSPSPTQDIGLGGDVWIDNQFADNIAPLPGTDGFQTIFHEIGHALGLDHAHEGQILSGDEDSRMYTVMSYRDHMEMWGVEPSTYMMYDIAALQYLYGTNSETAAGDDIYSFDDPNDLVMTIYDSGGQDALDASATEDDVVLDLRAGEFSSIGTAYGSIDAVNNISIAIGSEIEVAIGGSGNDLIIGNELDNLLTGGSGNDHFVLGTGGTDTVTDFEVGFDQIDLSALGIRFEDLLISSSDGGTLAHYGESSVILVDLVEEEVDESLFLF